MLDVRIGDTGDKNYYLSIKGGTSATLKTADTYVDKDIVISAYNSDGTTPPLIIMARATVVTDGTNRISFPNLPSAPVAWCLDMDQSTSGATAWDNKYRCISARKDNNGIVGYNIYKRKGNNTPYVYMTPNDISQSFSNGTLTITTGTTGNIDHTGPFLARTYVLMAICVNDGSTSIFRNN